MIDLYGNLRRCPFCGGRGEYEPSAMAIECRDCGGRGGRRLNHNSPTATEAWNRRTTTPPSYLSDPEWEGMTIERAFQMVAASRKASTDHGNMLVAIIERGTADAARAEAAERRVAELEAEVAECRMSMGGAVAAMGIWRTKAREMEAASAAAFFDAKAAWSLETFGPGDRYAGVVAHIRKELAEVEAKPADLEEWVDVVLLAMDGAWRSAGADGAAFVAALRAKDAKNRGRTWPDWRTLKPGDVSEHVKPKNPLTGLPCDSLRPTCQQPGCGECFPEAEAPIVHGVRLEKGQRWECSNGIDYTVESVTASYGQGATRVEPMVAVRAADGSGYELTMALRAFDKMFPRLLAPSEFSASEPAKVEAEPDGWAREGVWAVDRVWALTGGTSGPRPRKLVRPFDGSASQWMDAAGWEYPIDIKHCRPATPEEAERLEAEYQRNMAMRAPKETT